jgi:ribosomal protein L4
LAKKAESAAGDSAVSDKVSTVSLTSFEGSPSSSDKTPSVSAFLAAVSAFNLSEICKKNASRFADSIRAAASAA